MYGAFIFAFVQGVMSCERILADLLLFMELNLDMACEFFKGVMYNDPEMLSLRVFWMKT